MVDATPKVVGSVGGVGDDRCRRVGPCISARQSGWACASSGDGASVVGELRGFSADCGTVVRSYMPVGLVEESFPWYSCN